MDLNSVDLCFDQSFADHGAALRAHQHQPRIRDAGQQHFPERFGLRRRERLTRLPPGGQREAAQLHQPVDQWCQRPEVVFGERGR